MGRRKKSRRGSTNKRNGKVTFTKKHHIPNDDDEGPVSIDEAKRILHGTHGPEFTLDNIHAYATKHGLDKEQMLEVARQLSTGAANLPTPLQSQFYEDRRNKTRFSVIDPVSKYFEFCSIDARNVNVIGDFINDGVPIRLNNPSEQGTTPDEELATFIKTMRDAKIFAFATWWFEAAQTLWRVKLFRSFTEDWSDPFVGEDVTDLTTWMQKNGEAVANSGHEIFDKNWAHNASIGAPTDMPFSTMFVGFERDQNRHRRNNGILVYQRHENQIHTIHEMGIPNFAYAPDREQPVPLDFIYIDGIMWDMSGDRWTFGTKDYPEKRDAGMIWLMCSGYVITDPYCPADKDYMRIPVAVPIFVHAFKGRHIFDFKEESSDEVTSRAPTSWLTPNSYLPGPISSILTAIDEHRCVQSSFSLSQRKKRNKTNRDNNERVDPDDDLDLNITHKNYLRVKMSSSSKPSIPKISANDGGSLSGIIKKWTLKTRISIRSHERVKIYRGLKPIRDDDKKRLSRLGYTIYEDKNDVTRKDSQRLKLRGSGGPDLTHWVALKAIRIKEHERGPDGAPLTKVVRVADQNTATGSLRDDLAHQGPIT